MCAAAGYETLFVPGATIKHFNRAQMGLCVCAQRCVFGIGSFPFTATVSLRRGLLSAAGYRAIMMIQFDLRK